jgi:triacylglycerol lipase
MPVSHTLLSRTVRTQARQPLSNLIRKLIVQLKNIKEADIMKLKKTIAWLIATVLLVSFAACSSDNSSNDMNIYETHYSAVSNTTDRCATQYPLVMIHGLGWKDINHTPVEYYYNIPADLRANGCQVFAANQISMGGQKASADSLVPIVAQILVTTKSRKINLMGQSQGGLIGRYFIANEMIPIWWTDDPQGRTSVPASEIVVSFTSLGSPHNGSPVCDVIVGYLLPEGWIRDVAVIAIKMLYKFLWGEDVDPIETFTETSDRYMQNVFNKEIPLVGPESGGYKDGVYFQSFAGELDWSKKIEGYYVTGDLLHEIVFFPCSVLCTYYDGGLNDGFVSLNSARMGNFRGIIPPTNYIAQGVDHAYQINQFAGNTPGFDALEFYRTVVEDLKNRGF